jgi:hypothetical protein
MLESGGEQRFAPNEDGPGDLLDSWKEIAVYLQRDVTTVIRWEKREGLPVHRHVHEKQATVYAYRSEIDGWRAKRNATSGQGWFRFFSENKKTVVGVAGGVTLFLLVGLVAWMDIGSSSNPEASFQPYVLGEGYRLILDGDLDRAKPYVMRALDLITPEHIKKGPRGSIWILSFPAYDAFLAGDPETALFEAKNRLWDTLEGEPGAAQNIARYMLGALHLAAGQNQDSRAWFQRLYHAGRTRQYFLAAIAYVEDDHEAMTKYLKEMLETPVSLQEPVGNMPSSLLPRARLGGLPAGKSGKRCCTALLLARGGFLLEAEAMLSSTSTPSRGFEIQRGVLALSRGDRAEGIRMLEEAISSFHPLFEFPFDRRSVDTLVMEARKDSAAAYFMGSEILAEAWREEEELGKAVQVLKVASEQKVLLLADQSSPLTGALWVRVQGQLAQLYREMGRDAEARKIEEKLRALLAYADRDHPIVRQLDRSGELALRESAN